MRKTNRRDRPDVQPPVEPEIEEFEEFECELEDVEELGGAELAATVNTGQALALSPRFNDEIWIEALLGNVPLGHLPPWAVQRVRPDDGMLATT
ncbi:MAG: hypothetical protein ACOCX2_06905, partial [Armatimonadota bacterium]